MSVSSIENRIVALFTEERTNIAKSIEPTEQGCKDAAKKFAKLSKLESAVLPLLNEQKVVKKSAPRKRKQPSNYSDEDFAEDEDDDFEMCEPAEYTDEQLSEIVADLEVLDESNGMSKFRETSYGRGLFDQVLDQIGAQTGHQTGSSLAEKHTMILFDIDPDNVSLTRAKSAMTTKCYLCDIVHSCSYIVKINTSTRRIGSHCGGVAQAIVEFTTLLHSEYDDIEEHIKAIDQKHTELLEAHFNKKARKIN